MRPLADDTDPAAERVLIGLLRAASPARKFAMAVSAMVAARELALAGLRDRFPGDSAATRRRRLADLWLGPDLARKAYGPPPTDDPA